MPTVNMDYSEWYRVPWMRPNAQSSSANVNYIHFYALLHLKKKKKL